MKISFKRQEDVLPSTLIVLSIVILAATLAFQLLAPPPPTQASVMSSHKLALRRMNNEIHDLNEQAVKAQAQAQARLWHADAVTVSTSILASLTAQANRLSLKVAAFRPERTVILENMVEMPYSVQISGSYGNVRQVIASFDRATSKVALRSAQIASSSESNSHDVTATLQLSAYLPTTPIVAPATRTVTVTTVTGGAHGR